MAMELVGQSTTAEGDEETADGPLLDAATGPVTAMIARGRQRGYVTHDELNRALPPGEASSERIEDTTAILSEMGITIIEGEDPGDDAGERQPVEKPATAAPRIGEDDLGRTDDPVRLYLREMAGTALLTREGEVTLAKRIEAGRQTILDGLRESPLTMRAAVAWRDAIRAGSMALREVIDIGATHGGGQAAVPGNESDGQGPRNDRADAETAKDASESGDEPDEDKPPLSAMEAAVLPRTMETLDAVADATGSSTGSRHSASSWPARTGR